MRRHGESVWAPARRNGVTGSAPAGDRQATTLPPSTTNPAAGRSVHAPRLELGEAGLGNRVATVWAAWCGDGDPSRNATAGRRSRSTSTR